MAADPAVGKEQARLPRKGLCTPPPQGPREKSLLHRQVGVGREGGRRHAGEVRGGTEQAHMAFWFCLISKFFCSPSRCDTWAASSLERAVSNLGRYVYLRGESGSQPDNFEI